MASMVELGFRIEAFLGGNFSGIFSKANQALSVLSKHTNSLQKTSEQIGAYKKMQGSITQTAEKLNAARAKVKELGLQMRNTTSPTEAMKRQFTAANVEAHRLQETLGNQRRRLGELRSELHGAGTDTKNLASEQERLAQQSKKATDAQMRLQNAQARYVAAREKLSWNNIKGDFMQAAGALKVLQKPVQVSMDFEAAMARVNAVAFSGAGRNKEQDAKDFAMLQAQARNLGATTKFTAVDAASTQENLARAGFKANEIVAAMPGLLNMAAAEGMDLANAADIMAGALRGFNLDSAQTDRVANSLAQTSAASNTNIAELGEAMKYVAPIASGLGISIEQTNAMLGVMAN
ncbi:MAG: phage tail tape measure protein, partial [Synergistaceae bacterium]|nr:phage tail tape measure protein [Synergistaceae bacterium]MBR2209753.1 phage tail tape measure protein [Synergistaceae bacterium]